MVDGTRCCLGSTRSATHQVVVDPGGRQRHDHAADGADRHRRHPAGAARRGTGRRADPDLAAGLRPAELPEHLIVIGSGVTGAEFASAYLDGRRGDAGLQPRPGHAHEDADAAAVIEGCSPPAACVLANAARPSVRGDGRRRRGRAGRRAVDRGLARADGGRLRAEHRRAGAGRAYGVEAAGAATSRWTGCRGPTCPAIYAAGDCTGVLTLASVAAMQGRIAMWHALGEAVAPLRLKTVSANVFTDPEIATVGVPRTMWTPGGCPARR